jgi:hypothetical protein
MNLKTRQSTRRALLLALSWTSVAAGLWTPRALRAAEDRVTVAGYAFDRHLKLAGADLVLNGVGLRAVAWFKAYVAALYLSARASTAAEAVNRPGPMRLQLRTCRDLPAAEFVKALNVGLPRNSDPALLPALTERLARLAALIAPLDTLHEGDTIDLDYDPARGLLFVVNGKLRGDPIPGHDFYAALLRVFIGDQPSDTRLKAGLLGGSA